MQAASPLVATVMALFSRKLETPLKVLVEIEAPHWKSVRAITTHAGFETARVTLCELPMHRFRNRRGRGQNRLPTCPTCAERARRMVRELDAHTA